MTPTCDTVQQQIEDLLSEGAEAALVREATAFDRLTGARSKRLVLFGAGGLGRKTLAGLRRMGMEPLAFADSNPKLWGKLVEGVEILSPREAAARYNSTATFVITIWSGEATDHMRDRIKLLRELGCECVVTFGELFWKYSDVFLPHYAAAPAHQVHQQRDAVLEAARLWEDDASRQEYLSQIRWRLFLDFDGLADPVSHPIYFPADLCPLQAGEVFVDCGAYDGDTIVSFLRQPQPGFQRIIAFEPDPGSFARLRSCVEALPSRGAIEIHQKATGAENGTVLFSADGTPGAAVGSGSLAVSCVKLDDALRDTVPTYIKMDIEGSEIDTLKGAREIIERHAPVLAICSYHRQDHVWNIPRLIQSLRPGYRFFLRPHLAHVWDLVCYAIPEHRLIAD